MNRDPYEVLGISPDASEEELKKRYRTLVKQYHPDLHPDDEEAARMMSEINAAYESINSGDAGRYNSYSDNSSAYTGSSAPNGSFTRGGTTYYYSYSNAEDLFRAFFNGFENINNDRFRNFSYNDAFSTAEMYINNGNYYGAAEILNRINNRNGKWYYLASAASYGMNRISEAIHFAEEAVRQEPDNYEYRQLLERLTESYSTEIKHRKRVSSFISGFTIFIALMFGLQIIRPLLYLALR